MSPETTEEIRAVHRAMEASFAKSEADAHLSHYAPDATGYFPDFGPGLLRGEELRATLRSLLELPGHASLLSREETVEDFGEVALVAFRWPAGEGEVGRGTRVFRRGPEGWKCVHFHLSSAPPISSPLRERAG